MLAGVLDQIPYRLFYERRGEVRLGIGEVVVGGIRVEDTA